MSIIKKASAASKKAFLNYGIVIAFFVVFQILVSTGNITSALKGQLIPIACYMIMAVSLNLVVGISGELSLGHAGFMSVGAFTAVIVSSAMGDAANPAKLVVSIIVGALLAAIAGFLIGIPVLRLNGDYLKEVSIHIFGEGCYTFQPLYKLSKETLLKWSDKVTEFVESGNDQVYAENAMNEISDTLDIFALNYCKHYINEIDDVADLSRVSREIEEYENR